MAELGLGDAGLLHVGVDPLTQLVARVVHLDGVILLTGEVDARKVCGGGAALVLRSSAQGVGRLAIANSLGLLLLATVWAVGSLTPSILRYSKLAQVFM